MKAGIQRQVLFFLFALSFFARIAWAEGDVRILIRGQEMVFDSLSLRDGVPYVSADDKSLARVSALLGGEKNQLPSPQTKDFSIRDLAKLYGASVSHDSDRNIWYVDPWVSGVVLDASRDKTTVKIQSSTLIQPTVTRLENPPRLAVDFPYAELSENFRPPSSEGSGLVEKVEVAQFQNQPNIVRVVLYLIQPDIQWATEVDEQNKAFSVVVSPAFVSPLQGGTSKPLDARHGPSFLGGIELKTVGQGSDQKLAADLKLSRPVSFAWRKLRSPDNRVYIDFLNCLLGMGRSIDLNNPYFEVIRVAQFQRAPVPIVRVVFQLRQPFHVDIQNSPEGLQIDVSSRVEDAGEVLSGGGTTGFSPEMAALHGNRFTPRSPSHPNGIVLVLDPGHGGTDPGARGRLMVEKDVTLDIAERLREKLTEHGFTVLMTRTADQDVLGYHGSAKAELQARVNVADRASAMMFISLHINSSDYSWPHGLQTHWYKRMDLPLANAIQRHLRSVSAFVDRGIARDRFYVLHHSSMPAVLVEMGFLSNAADESKLENSAIRDQLAEAIAGGVVEYSGVERNAHL